MKIYECSISRKKADGGSCGYGILIAATSLDNAKWMADLIGDCKIDEEYGETRLRLIRSSGARRWLEFRARVLGFGRSMSENPIRVSWLIEHWLCKIPYFARRRDAKLNAILKQRLGSAYRSLRTA